MRMQAVTANRLDDGFVVYLTPAGTWSERLSDCALAIETEASALLARAGAGPAAGEVVGPYLIAVEVAGGRVRPLGQRERLRTLGPSVRPDLGYQAEER